MGREAGSQNVSVCAISVTMSAHPCQTCSASGGSKECTQSCFRWQDQRNASAITWLALSRRHPVQARSFLPTDNHVHVTRCSGAMRRAGMMGWRRAVGSACIRRHASARVCGGALHIPVRCQRGVVADRSCSEVPPRRIFLSPRQVRGKALRRTVRRVARHNAQ